MFLIMKKNNAPNGRPKTLFKHMLMDASMSIDASSLMVGKSKSIILLIIKCTHADKQSSVKNLIAHTTTPNKIEDSLLISSLKSFLKIEVLMYFRRRYINLYFLIFFSMSQAEYVRLT